MSTEYPILDNRPIDKWKVTELKEELKRRKLTTRGLKKDLVKRLGDALRIERQNTATNDDHRSVDALGTETQNTATNDDPHSVDALGIERQNTATNDDPHSVDARRIETENTATNDDHHSQPIVDARRIETENTATNDDHHSQPIVDARRIERENTATNDDHHSQPIVDARIIERENTATNDDPHSQPIVEEEIENTMPTTIVETLKDVVDHGDSGVPEVPLIQQHLHVNSDVQIDNEGPKLENDVDALNKLDNGVDDMQDSSSLNKLENDVDDMQDYSALNKLDNDVDDMHDSSALSKLDNDVDDMQDSSSALKKPQNDVDDMQDSSSALKKPQNDVDDMQDSSSALNKPQNDVDDMQDSSSALNKPQNDVDDMQDSSALNKPENDVDDMQDSSALNKLENDVDDMQDSSGLNKLENDVDDMQDSSALKKQVAEVKSDPVSENIEVKDNNAKLSIDVVKPEMDEESVKNKASVDERDYHNNDSGETGYSEKLNLDRSCSDEFMEEDLVETKQIDEIGDKSVKNGALAAVVVEDGSSTVEKRKLDDEEAIEAPKRHKLDSATNLTLTMQLAALKSKEERVVPASQKPPTSSLRVDNFVRPFTLKAVQQLLGETGTVTSFWMDEIKTHCYVNYSSTEEAIETRNAIYNLQWPPNGGRQLLAEFVDPHQLRIHLQTCPGNQLSPPESNSTPPLVPPESNSTPPLVPPESPMPTIDDIFWRTKATPKIYYLPLSKEQVAAKQARRDI